MDRLRTVWPGGRWTNGQADNSLAWQWQSYKNVIRN